MKRSIFSKVFPVFLAGLIFGSAERVFAASPAEVPVGISQSESVLYALTLVDANNTQALPGTSTTEFRVCLTVSVPRSGIVAPAIGVSAVPATVMYRPHNGKDGTAWSGAIFMSAEEASYYPMPQTGTIDRTPVARGAEIPDTLTNLAPGTVRDPARWERRFYSNKLTSDNPLVASLLNGEATYEWYVASRYGLGFFSVVSDIQDHGRKMDFSDYRLWEGQRVDDESDDAWDARFGTNNYHTLNSMYQASQTTGFAWQLNKVAVGAMGDTKEDKGALLLQDTSIRYADISASDTMDALNSKIDGTTKCPSIVSPLYPDGVSNVTFKAKVGLGSETSPQYLLIQAKNAANSWTTEGLTIRVDGGEPFTQAVARSERLIRLNATLSTISVSMDEETVGLANTQFRIVRISSYENVVSDPASLVVCVRDLRVRSATPKAIFAEPYVTTGTNVAPACEDEPFTVNFVVTPNATRAPRGYSANLKLARRVESDSTRSTYSVPLEERIGTTQSTLFTTFEPIGNKYQCDKLGENNLSENAFYLNKGIVSGVMAGIYDMTLECALLGSFEAGRTTIDGRERTVHNVSALNPPVDAPEQVMRPFILDVREAKTDATKVELVINYVTTGLDEDEFAGAVMKTTVVEMVPTGLAEKTWSVDLPKELMVSTTGKFLTPSSTEDRDNDAEYAWCESTNAADAQKNVVSFQLRVTRPNNLLGEEPVVRWYGQTEVLSEGQTPESIAVYPGTSFATSTGVNPDDLKTYYPAPVLINLAENVTSHITVTFVEGEGAEAAGTLSVNGAFVQDFNTWDSVANGRFSNSEFRENVLWAVADFNATVEENANDYYQVTSGWAPDQGPLAETTEFYDTFIAGRGYGDAPNEEEHEFYVKDIDTQGAEDAFASWGASHETASPRLLRSSSSGSVATQYFKFDSLDGAELVINRDVDDMHSTSSNGWMPDLMVRLSNTPKLSPRDGLGLKGIGTLSFNLSRSEPYDISQIYQFAKLSTITDSPYTGLSATVSTASHTKAGYSTSLYLINGTTYYELRVTQILKLDGNQDHERKPNECLVMELWKWEGGSPSRMKINTGLSYKQINSPTSLNNQNLAVWVDENNKLRAQVGTANEALIISDTEVASTYMVVAVGSAECWPTFSNLAYATAPSNNRPSTTSFTGDDHFNGYTSAASGTWSRVGGESSVLTVQRNKLSPEKGAQLLVKGFDPANEEEVNLDTIICKDADAETPISITVGRTDLELRLYAAKGSHLFIDNIRISSWQGNDEVRNKGYVPDFTDAGWDPDDDNDGFSAVGVWILPEDESQNTVQPENYIGNQCLLMHYSRRNTASNLSIYDDDALEITHTGSTLALYTPCSTEGWGAMTFRYRIPSMSEFKVGVPNQTVYLLLQYHETKSPVKNNLESPEPNSSWQNVSGLIELPVTGGEWKTISVTPRLNGAPLLATHPGVLRLVMVAPSSVNVDPYVYLDDVRITSNSGEKALWSSGNTLIASDPISALYWKDRTEANKQEGDFAWYSRLVRGLLFNHTTNEDTENDDDLPAAYLASPVTPNGVGLVKFAARLNTANATPTVLGLYVTTQTDNPTFPEDYTRVEEFSVTDTVYRQFSVDLAKDKDVLDAKAIRGVYLYAPTLGDAVDAPKIETSRVWVDKFVVAEPIAPTLRLSNVTFSTVPGDDFAMHTRIPEGAEAIYNPQDGRNSPLSQPIAGAPLVVKATVDRMQQVKPGSVRVFFTYDKTTNAHVTASTTYTYEDVFGASVGTDDLPTYAWMPEVDASLAEESLDTAITSAMEQLTAWSLSSWFAAPKNYVANLLSVADAVTRKANFDGIKANAADLNTTDFGTVELAALESYDATDMLLTFVTDADNTLDIVKSLAPNSMVRYSVWAIFETEDSTDDNPRYGYAILDASSYTEHPWYFPRNFNMEMRGRYNRLAEFVNKEPATSDLFSPYFWVYDTVPGEVFINEFNLRDATNSSAQNLASFIEICAPTSISLYGWRLDNAVDSTFEANNKDPILDVEDMAELTTPQAGVVPVQRQTGSLSNRTFYTLVKASGFPLVRLVRYKDGVAEDVTEEPSHNAGRAQNGSALMDTTRNVEAATLRLYRPTGGIEHMVCFSQYKSNSSSSLSEAIANLDELVTTYRARYKQEKFGSEWFQAFREGGWDVHKLDEKAIVDVDATNTPISVTEAHRARRMAVAKYYNGNEDNGSYGNYNRENAVATPSFITDCYSTVKQNSVATVDMGGVWVMRTNNTDEAEGSEEIDAGPTDLSDLFADRWPGYNPTEKTRSGATVDPPAAQITPRQINLDQYMLYYADPNGNSLTSKIEGLGQHKAEFYNGETPPVLLNTVHGGRNQLHRSIASASSVKLTYTPLAFHELTSLTLMITNTKDGVLINKNNNTITTNGTEVNIIDRLLEEMKGKYSVDNTDETQTIISFDITDHTAAYDVLFDTAIDANLYSFEFNATFVANTELSKDVIQTVRPFCGDTLRGSAMYQPWKGSSFGFSALYNTEKLAAVGARLVGAIVTYPTPLNVNMDVENASWTGLNTTNVTIDGTATTIPSLTGMEEADAWEALNTLADEGLLRTASLGTTRKRSDAQSEIYNAAAVPVLANAYDAGGIEPAIPYIVWGVYSVTIQVGAETETIRYLMPQEVAAARSPMPKWYQPLTRLTRLGTDLPLPYFYLYSTPPESAWLNEVNLIAGTGEDPFAEVVFPVLRAGIINAGVPQPSIEGWSVKSSKGEIKTFTDEVGAPAGASSSYQFYSIDLTPQANGDAVGYALIRPCGAGEGGVWTGFDANGGTAVTAITEAEDIMGMWMREGETDAANGTGSVQLVGITTDINGYDFISSYADERTTWKYNETPTRDKNNVDVKVDNNPEWNRVRVTSTLLNTVYGGSPCGYHDFDNLPESTLPIGFGEDESFAGGAWVSTIENGRLGRYITYRPRAGYTYDYLQIPPEWMGRVILVGQQIAKRTEAFPETRIIDLATQALTYSNNFTDSMDKAAALVALNGFATAERSGGAFTGKIVFNGDKELSEDLLFKDADDYVIAVLLIEEPIAATNELTMALRPGTVEAGAWLVSQTLYGLKMDANKTWVPDEDKGGIVETNPIWDDESGNGEGEYLNRHGWLYQPLVGDTLSMSAVIRPDNGLYSDDIDVVAAMTSENPTIRPMLIWTVIDKNKVPLNLFTTADATDPFLSAWDMSSMVGGTPSFRDGISTNFTTVRQNIEAANKAGATTSTLYIAGGVLPMTLRGIRDIDDDTKTEDFVPKSFLTQDEVNALNQSDAPYLAYSVMTQDELDAATVTGASLATIAGLPTNATDDGMVDLTSNISMVNTATSNYWQEGAILRFAVVLVDVTTGRILDAQGISNFKSDDLPVYCPWYVPEETADINYVSKAKKVGYAPYAWLYNIGFNDVWINEIRPFSDAATSDIKEGDTIIELAMIASPYTETGAPSRPTYEPEKSLDGWKIVVKYAPMPQVNAITDDTKMEWVRSTDAAVMQDPNHPLYGRTIELKSWVPARRISPGPSEDASTEEKENYWALDYYCIATSANALASLDEATLPNVKDYLTCVEESNPHGFAYLKTATVTTTSNPFDDYEVDKTTASDGSEVYNLTRHILPNYEKLLEKLAPDYYSNGLVFGIELIRNNGVVTDEILFMYKNGTNVAIGVADLLDTVVEIEKRNFAAANEIRAIPMPVEPQGLASWMFVDEVVDADGDNMTDTILRTTWEIGLSNNSPKFTFPGGNNMFISALVGGTTYNHMYKQPRLRYTYSIAETVSLSATILGGRLGITQGINSLLPVATARFTKHVLKSDNQPYEINIAPPSTSVSCPSLLKGTEYSLYVAPVVDEWFDLKCNGAIIDPIHPPLTETFAVNGEILTLPVYKIVSKVELETDTSYTIDLTPNADAQDLTEDAAFTIAQDANYELWLVASGTPEEIKKVLDLDHKLTLAEKYWLGFENAIDDSGENVTLGFTYVGSTLATDGETILPTIAVKLQNGTTPITSLRSDGALFLLGKERLSDPEWSIIQTRLNTKTLSLLDINADKILNLNTEKKYFKVILAPLSYGDTAP